MEKKFKCKDEVIYRSKIEYGNHHWTYGRFSHYEHKNDFTFAVLSNGNRYNITCWEILPYEGNEHLVGSQDEPETEVRLEEGEWIIPADKVGVFEKVVNCIIRQFDYVEGTLFKCKNSTAWTFAIRFSDFNPNDMEETKKHILCVKNGKIIRYKG